MDYYLYAPYYSGFYDRKIYKYQLCDEAGYFCKKISFYRILDSVVVFIGTCVAVALVYILLKLKFSPNAILAISLIIYLSIGCLSNAYSMFGEMLISKYHWVSILTQAYLLIFGDTKNGFVFGFFFVAMGMKLAFSTEKKFL